MSSFSSHVVILAPQLRWPQQSARLCIGREGHATLNGAVSSLVPVAQAACAHEPSYNAAMKPSTSGSAPDLGPQRITMEQFLEFSLEKLQFWLDSSALRQATPTCVTTLCKCFSPTMGERRPCECCRAQR